MNVVSNTNKFASLERPCAPTEPAMVCTVDLLIKTTIACIKQCEEKKKRIYNR